jgi:GAF domain
MDDSDLLRAEFGAAMAGADSALAAADLLCQACVELLRVDGASISLMYDGTTRGTFGSSGPLSRRLDELQFTFGEGPCLESVRDSAPVLVPDFDTPGEWRWPAFSQALLESGVCAVFAMPIRIARSCVGALDLFRRTRGPLTPAELEGSLMAAELAALPLLDLITADIDWDGLGQGVSGWEELASLERVEVYQATGMIVAATGIGPAEALVRLRARAIADGLTASELAWAIVERRLPIDVLDSRADSGLEEPIE